MNLTKVTALLALASIVPGCGNGAKLRSHWADRQIRVDGQQTEWDGGVAFLEDKNISLGFFNDDEYLYVSMSTADRKVLSQFMAMGFHLWLDPDGERSRAFGVKFPIGMMDLGIMMRGRGESRGLEAMKERFEQSLVNLELTLPGEDEPRLLKVEQARGIEVQVGDVQDGLVYEIKVPLYKSDDHPFAIQVQPGKAIAVGFETAQFDRKRMRERMGNGGFAGRPGGFGGGRGGGRPGGRGGFGGGRGMGRPERPQPLRIWAEVTLSSNAGGASAIPQPTVVSDSRH